MEKYLQIFIDAYKGYANYLLNEILHPSSTNYFYWLLLVSLFFFALERLRPWRKSQPKFRKDFWLDFFYMFFNFFLFSLLIYNAASDVVVNLFNDGIKTATGFDLGASNPMRNFPYWLILLIGFVVRDFVQWWVHRLLHRSERLWQFHKVHHSVQQMGFAAHLRYHWMENVVYRSIEYIPLALLGIGLHDFFIIHIFTLSVGHYNHSNITVSGKTSGAVLGVLLGLFIVTQTNFSAFSASGGGTELAVAAGLGIVLPSIVFGAFVLGPYMKIIFNSPEMHIWHHAHDLPKGHPHGINFGITLAIWDYIFGTASIPHSGRDIQLGFPGMEDFPQDFVHQNLYGFGLIDND